MGLEGVKSAAFVLRFIEVGETMKIRVAGQTKPTAALAV
jgi:hypothetical protein